MSEKNLNQTDVAKILNVSQGSVSDWLSGAMPRRSKLQKIADYFNVEISVLTDNAKNIQMQKDSPLKENMGAEKILKIFDKLPKESVINAIDIAINSGEADVAKTLLERLKKRL